MSDVSSLIARWENLTRLLYSWTAPEASAVEWADSQIIPLEKQLDALAPDWHEPWSDRPRRSALAEQVSLFADRPENQCLSCGTGVHAVVERSETGAVSGEGDVRCARCGSKIRDWDAG